MNLKINPKISIIYANLLRLGIGKYLISSKFKHLCIEKNLDEAWDRCKELVINERGTYIVSTNYTGYAEEALGIFLTNLFPRIVGQIKFSKSSITSKFIMFLKVVFSL